jgi:hypothetical protein
MKVKKFVTYFNKFQCIEKTMMKNQGILEIIIRFKDVVQIALIWFASLLFCGPGLLIAYEIFAFNKNFSFKVVIVPILGIVPGIIFMNHFFKLWNALFKFKKVILHEEGKVTFINGSGQNYLLDVYADIDIVYADSNKYQITFKKGKKYFIINSDNVTEKELFIEFFKHFIKGPIDKKV